MYGKLVDRNASWSWTASTTCSKRNATPSTGSFTATTSSARCCSILTLATPSCGPDCCQPCRRPSCARSQSDLANWTRGDRKARFEQTAERHAGLSQFAAPFLTRMKFVDEQGEGTSPTLSELRAYRERRGLPPDAPLDFAHFAPMVLQPLIRHNGVTDRRRWKSALFLKVRDDRSRWFWADG